MCRRLPAGGPRRGVPGGPEREGGRARPRAQPARLPGALRPRQPGCRAERPPQAGRRGADPSRILTATSPSPEASRSSRRPQGCEPCLPGSAAGPGEPPEDTTGPCAGAQDALPGWAPPAAALAPPSAPPLRPPRLLLHPRCLAPSPPRLSHKEQEMAMARVSKWAPLRGQHIPDLHLRLPPQHSQLPCSGDTEGRKDSSPGPACLGTLPAAVGGWRKLWTLFGSH